jgi:hypothetical protein
MIKIHVERRQSKQLFWCQACESKQSRTVTISSNDVQSSSLHLCDNCLKELADKIHQELNTTKTIVVSNITIDEEKLIRMYLERFSNFEINDDDNKLIINYSDAFEGNLINEYLDCLANVVNINVERQRKNEGV